jgi:hypothetical protein
MAARYLGAHEYLLKYVCTCDCMSVFQASVSYCVIDTLVEHLTPAEYRTLAECCTLVECQTPAEYQALVEYRASVEYRTSVEY